MYTNFASVDHNKPKLTGNDTMPEQNGFIAKGQIFC